MQEYLPEEHRLLSMEADVLPGNSCPPMYPFLGCVINFNVATRAHRDPKDKKYCLVLPIGEYTGGELCLVEPGLVLDVNQGDIVVFRSSEITHFNLHFSGLRASMVLQTDREMSAWSSHKNGWETNKYFQ